MSPFNTLKPSNHLLAHHDALETPPEYLNHFITPVEDFFAYSATLPPTIDIDTWSLTIHGDAIDKQIQLTFDELLRMPVHTVICYLECAGNHRLFFETINGQALKPASAKEPTPWAFGGIGNAIWTGVKLGDLLNLAGVKANACDVNAKGLDVDAPEGGVSRPMPIEKALDPDTIVAYMMNGEMLLPDHGYPARLIVPGWIGSNSIKWVGSIEVSSQKIWVDRNTKRYVMIGEPWKEHQEGEIRGGPITTQNVKSSLNLAWDTHLAEGKQKIRGVARSPHALIQTVDWQVEDRSGNLIDSGRAKLLPPFLKWAWTYFEFEWDAKPGDWVIKTQATDELGNTQPASIPLNYEGYLFNQVIAHPVTVTDSE